jgi:uncharacterized protein
MKDTKLFLTNFTGWAKSQNDIEGLFLVGSYAKNLSRENSDIDLVIITKEPIAYLDNPLWIDNFGKPKKIIDEDWGLLRTKRVFYDSGLEVEFNFTNSDWIKTNPIDEGTKKVLTDGNKILLDKTGQLKSFIDLLEV